MDLAVEPIPYPDNTFDEVEASQVLEHIPAQIRWVDVEWELFEGSVTVVEEDRPTRIIPKKVWKLRFARVELMREIHRVLKPGGVLVASVPGVDIENGPRDKDGKPLAIMRWAQDPTHVDVPWILESFDYFCNAWGGGLCKHEAHYSSGINFGFHRIREEYSKDESVLTVWLQK